MDHNPWDVESIQAFSHLKCPECSFDTKEENLFENNATENHPRSIEFFGKVYNKRETYDLEIKSEPDDKKHIESVHEGKKPFTCTICNSSYTRKLSLRQHIATVHEGNKPYACTLCKSSYTRKLTLRKHMATVHEVKNEPDLEYDIIEELDRNAIKAEPITDYEDMEEENYSDKKNHQQVLNYHHYIIQKCL